MLVVYLAITRKDETPAEVAHADDRLIHSHEHNRARLSEPVLEGADG